MDWIKIKTKHVLNSQLTLGQIGALTKYQCLIAQLERMPTETELHRLIRKREWDSLVSALQSIAQTLPTYDPNVAQTVAKCVLNDAQKVAKHRQMATERKHKERINKEVALNVTRDSINTDKHSIDKHNIYTNTKERDKLADWIKIREAYPNKASITKAMQLYFAAENLNCDLVIKAILNYKVHLAANEWKKPMNLDRFLGELDAWVNHTEPEKPKTEPKKPEGRSYEIDNNEFKAKLESWKKAQDRV